MNVAYLDLADFLATSELVLGNPAEGIARVSRLELAESALHAPAASFGGIEFHPDLAIKARGVVHSPCQEPSAPRVAATRTPSLLWLVGSGTELHPELHGTPDRYLDPIPYTHMSRWSNSCLGHAWDTFGSQQMQNDAKRCKTRFA